MVPPSIDAIDLQHLIAVMFDHLDRDLAGLGSWERRLVVEYNADYPASSISARRARLSLS